MVPGWKLDPLVRQTQTGAQGVDRRSKDNYQVEASRWPAFFIHHSLIFHGRIEVNFRLAGFPGLTVPENAGENHFIASVSRPCVSTFFPRCFFVSWLGNNYNESRASAFHSMHNIWGRKQESRAIRMHTVVREKKDERQKESKNNIEWKPNFTGWDSLSSLRRRQWCRVDRVWPDVVELLFFFFFLSSYINWIRNWNTQIQWTSSSKRNICKEDWNAKFDKRTRKTDLGDWLNPR